MADSGYNSTGKERGGFRGRGNNNWRSNRWRGRGYQRGHGSTRNNANNDGNELITIINLFLTFSKECVDSPSNNDAPSSEEHSDTQIRQRNRIDQHFPPVPCPYKGWKHYFPSEGFTYL